MDRLLSSVKAAFISQDFVEAVIEKEVPWLSRRWGVEDKDALLHALGANLIAAFGRACGYIGLVEFPTPRSGKWRQKPVRVDAAWIDPAEKRPRLLAEFQRWDNLNDARDKAANLFVASHGLGSPAEVLLLVLWSLDGEMPTVTALEAEHALPVSGGPDVTCPEGSHLLTLHALFGRKNDRLHLRAFRSMP
jgi:hypothetical protein